MTLEDKYHEARKKAINEENPEKKSKEISKMNRFASKIKRKKEGKIF